MQLDDIEPDGLATGFCERLYVKTGPVADRLARLYAGLHSPVAGTHTWPGGQVTSVP